MNDVDVPDESWECIKQSGLHCSCAVLLFHVPVPVIQSYSSFHLFCRTDFLSPFPSNTVLFLIALVPSGILRNCKCWLRTVIQSTIHTFPQQLWGRGLWGKPRNFDPCCCCRYQGSRDAGQSTHPATRPQGSRTLPATPSALTQGTSSGADKSKLQV